MKNKLLKKIGGLFGYRLIEKRVYKNNKYLLERSTLNIDKLLDAIFSINSIKNLIQIGANDGLSFDNLNHYIKKYKCHSLLVEPIKNKFQSLKENYKNLDFIEFENSAVTVGDEINSLYKVDYKYEKYYGDHATAIQSFDKSHLLNHGIKKSHITSEKVNSIKIIDLIEKYKIDELDLLFLDCEGYDGNIVIDFLLTVKKSPIIIFEFVHIEKDIFEKVLNELDNKNYLYFSINENIICYPKNKEIIIKLN